MDLVADRIGHGFGNLPVLDDVTFRVASGEILVVIGPSGCGKSTLLGILGGILKPDRGRVAMEGKIPADSLNPVTFVFQDFALLPWRSVAANVSLPLEHHALATAERDQMVADALRRTGLQEFAEAFPKQLSGGMRQRVGIARALVVRPALLLMDEPLSALDAQTRELLMEDFLDLWIDQRITAVYVTHNLAEALRLADRVVVLSRRPGVIKEIVSIPIPQRDRAAQSAEGPLRELSQRLWSLIRDEAQAADRELAAHG
jgi:NitT/TauT family transport system ATP-binding protein